MTDAPNTSSYLLVNPDPVALPNSRILDADPFGSNLQFTDGGPGGALTLAPTLNLLALATMTTPGLLVYTGSTLDNRSLTSDGSISFSNPSGATANPTLAVVDNTTIQFIQVQTNGVNTANPRSILNFISGANVTVNAVDNGSANRTDVTISSTGGGGSGTITEITSTGLTMAIGAPTGPVVNVDLAVTNSPALNDFLKVTQIAPTLELSWEPGEGGGGITTLSSTSGVLFTDPSGPEAIINLDGSGVSNAVALGDLLTGQAGGVYAALAHGGANSLLFVNGDLNTLQWSASTITNNELLFYTTGGPQWLAAPTVADTVLTYDGDLQTLVWAPGDGSGTVTSVGLVASGGILQGGSASPITGAGSFTLTLDGSGGSNVIELGDILRGSAGAYAALAIGTAGQILTSDGNTFNWVTPTPDPGNAGQALLGAGGVFQVLNADITASSSVVATGSQVDITTFPDYTGPAAGPITVTLQPGVGFTLTGDGAGDLNKGVAWVLEGGSATSGVSSIIPDGGILGTNLSGPAVTLTLTGSNPGNNAIVTGDLLLGSPGAYEALPVGTIPGQVLTVGESSEVVWQIPSASVDDSFTVVDCVMWVTAGYYGMPSYTYQNGTAGVGATILFTDLGELLPTTIDNYYGQDGTLGIEEGIRILVVDNNNPTYSGIYTLTHRGNVAVQAQLTRAGDWNMPSLMIFGRRIYVTPYTPFIHPSGNFSVSTFSDQFITFMTEAPITIGTTPCEFRSDVFKTGSFITGGSPPGVPLAGFISDSTRAITQMPNGGRVFYTTSFTVYVNYHLGTGNPGVCNMQVGSFDQSQNNYIPYTRIFVFDPMLLDLPSKMIIPLGDNQGNVTALNPLEYIGFSWGGGSGRTGLGFFDLYINYYGNWVG